MIDEQEVRRKMETAAAVLARIEAEKREATAHYQILLAQLLDDTQRGDR